MKTPIYIYALFLLFLVTPIAVAGQQSATATFTASVRIIEPIEIETTSNMNFAGIDAQDGGSVTLSPDNMRTTSGSIELADAIGASAASFKVKGQAGYTYDIVLPESSHVLSNGTESIIIRDFTSDFNSARLTDSSHDFKVGATLDINPNQKPGIYTSNTPMQVTVNYN